MRTVASLLLLTTAAPSASPATPPRRPAPNRVVEVVEVDPTAEAHVPVHRAVVRLPADGPWLTRARDAYEVDTDELMTRLLPEPGAWPDGALEEVLREALCVDAACDDTDQDAAWRELAERLEERGLLEAAPGSVGSSWERYATLWWGFVSEGGAFMGDEPRHRLQEGVLDALEHTPEGPLREPLLLGALMLDASDPEPLLWELLDAPDEALAVLALEGLVAEGVPVAAFDELDLPPDGPLALHRLRLQVEAAEAEGREGPLDALSAHPLATVGDREDVRELRLRRGTETPPIPWLAALVEEAGGCAGLVAGEGARLEARAGVWMVAGEGALAACLEGGAWGSGADVDVVLQVTR